MPTTANRRPLAFASLDQVMPDVDRLIDGGYSSLGKWTLGQVCHHLAGGVMSALEDPGFKAPWLLRKVVAPLAFRSIMKSGKMPEGVNGPPKLIPAENLDDRAEVEALRGAIRLFKEHTGPIVPHGFFGPLNREQTERIHCIHCAHHLSFLVPNGSL